MVRLPVDFSVHRMMVSVALLGALGGCASHGPGSEHRGPTTAPTTGPAGAVARGDQTTRPTATSGVAGKAPVPAGSPQSKGPLSAADAGDSPAVAEGAGKANVPLEHVPPMPTLHAPAKTSAPPPVQSLDLYAQARIAMLDNQRYTAINLIEKAVALDPQSWELRFTLAKLYQGNNSYDDRSIAALVAADTLDPDHLQLQTSMGRQLLAKGDTSGAVEHLLLAQQTQQYARDGAGAATADFFLGSALRQQGYDRAALTVFERLQIRLRNPGFEIRATPELALLAAHPETVALQVGELQQRCGHYADALANLQMAVNVDPRNWDLQARIVRVLLAMKRTDDAAGHAAELVVREHASTDSISLLREVLTARGRESDVSDELGRLYQSHPASFPLLYAQLDLLRSEGRMDDADRALRDAAQRRPDDFELFTRRFNLLASRGDRNGAATLLITATARKSEWCSDAAPLLADLLRPSGQGARLTLANLRSLQTPASAAAAKQFWVARAATAWHHQDVSDDALSRAVSARPPFAPAWREKLERIWDQTDLDDSQKAQASQSLIDAAASLNAAALADELAGLNLTHQKQWAAAVDKFNSAIKRGDGGPDVLLALANAQRETSEDAAFESTLWKTVSDWPLCRDAHLELYSLYLSRSAPLQAERVLTNWLVADPTSVVARRIQARDDNREGRPEACEAILLRMFNERGDDPEVLAALTSYFSETNRLDEYQTRLADRVAHEPGNLAAVSDLVDLQMVHHQSAETLKTLDALRTASANDPDVLYNVAGLYARADLKAQSEQTLRDVLRLDPSHPGASNDLGYELAESGKDLATAEAMVRRAVGAEPHNASFLDSMGWVLYKRGRFGEAEKYLLEALGPSQLGDPVVLDHLGDTLYRLGEVDRAAQVWKHASEGLDSRRSIDPDESDDEGRTLRTQLQQKTGAVAAGKPPVVAPIIELNGATTQAAK